MKESILNRLKKYDTGGTDWNKTGSLIAKTLKAGAKFAGRNVLGPISTLLGANKAYATPVYNEHGINRFTGEYLGTGEPLPNVDVNQVNQELSKVMASKLQMGGVQPLPGGVMESIPGSDAVVFKGATHDQGGINIDEQTEVEGGGIASDGTLLEGETMDQVNMAKTGGKRDYFFSDHLKKGGRSFADLHKEILANGGNQEDINMLAKMQENAAGRDPNQVAKLGGIMKYGKGGYMKYNEGGGRINLEQIRSMYPQYAADIENLQNYNPNISAEENRLNENMRKGNYLYDDSDITYVDTPAPSQDLIKIPPRTIPLLPTTPFDEKGLITKVDMPEGLGKLTLPKMSEEEIALANSGSNTYDSYLARIEMSGKMPPEGILSEKEYNKQQRQLARILNPGMPTEAWVGAGAQFLPAVTAMFTRQKDPKQFEYTPGFTSPIVAGRVKGLKYEAPNQNEARARLASSYLGQQRFLDTSGAGAAGLSNRQSLFAQKLAAEGALGAQESKDRITAENLTKKSAEQANIRNVQNELQAATTNAQLIQKEADRRQAIDNANIQLEHMKENEKIANRMAIVNNLASGISGVTGDVMSYKAQERMAKAIGSDGIYNRDILFRYLKSQNPGATDDELNLLTIETLKKLA